MLVLQQVKVLPKGAEVIVYDGFEIVLHFKKSSADGTPMFDDIKDAERYDKVYSTFKVHGLKGYIFNPSITFTHLPGTQIIYQIQVREGFDNESEGAACSDS